MWFWRLLGSTSAACAGTACCVNGMMLKSRWESHGCVEVSCAIA